jgi:iron complex outermembrane recepter protein
MVEEWKSSFFLKKTLLQKEENMNQSNRITLFTRLLAVLLVFGMALVCDTAMGQQPKAKEGQPQEEFLLEEIVITGSRIVRRDYESSSPIVTIQAADFEMQTGLNIESYLNQLPEYNPAASPVTSQGDVQITPVNSVGVATISLRGFGPNRNLNLIDGKRIVPVNALLWTDINGIPSSLIERVETITGGASAVYGADAVGGVTNFILKKNYEGVELDGQYGMQEHGNGTETRVSMLIGANFADGRGNVTFGAERYNRDEVLARDISWYTDRWSDPNAGGYFFFLQGTNGYSCSPTCPSWGAYKALFGGVNPGGWYIDFFGAPTTVPSYVNITFNSDGTIWSSGSPIGQSRSEIVPDGMLFAYQTMLDPSDIAGMRTFQGLKWNETDQLASGPQNRYSIYANGHYDLSDKISIFADARFAESRTATFLFGTDAISGWEASVPYNPTIDSPIDPTLDYTNAAVLAAVAADPAAFFRANPNPNFIPTGSPGAGHPVPTELAWLLNSRTPQDARWQPQWFPDTSLPGRQTTNTISTWQLEAGLDFEMPFRDWKGEIYLSHGVSETYNVAGGNLSLARYRALINYPDYGRNSEGTGNQWYLVQSENGTEVVPAVRPAFGVGDFKCTSGFYNTLFGGDQPLSEDCFNAVNAVLQTYTEMTQDITEVNLQGGLFNLPAGEVRTAVGWQYREVGGKFNPDILQSEDSFMDQVVGVYPTGYMDAKTRVNDYYIEALFPVLSDLPFMKKLELETGARRSNYKETQDKEWTYKILANWEFTNWVRLRGGYNRAIRAPNLGELFLAQQEIFTFGGKFGDPCSVRANAPWGAGGTTLQVDEVISAGEKTADNPTGVPQLAPGQTQAGADRTYQICSAMMGSKGADDYYRNIVGGNDNLRDFAQQGAGGGFAWVLQTGNPDLKPETADTWTAGIVMSSPLENPWVSGITLGLDWYKIDITDAIMTFSIDYASFRCFGLDTGLSPAAQAASTACKLVPRDQNNGAALSTTLSYDNQATISTSGLDILFNWFFDFARLGVEKVPGTIGFSLQATLLDSYETRQSPAPYDAPIEWKGSLGPNLPGTQAGAYDYRLFGTLTYNNTRDKWSVSMRARYLPPVWTAAYAEQQSIIANNAAVTAGGAGVILGYTPTTEIQTDSYTIFDFSGTWDINDTYSLRFGITNLFDKAPPDVGSTAGYAPGMDRSTVCQGAPGCSNPTAYSLYARGGFSGGYYDTLGRRFFMGLKARF